MGLMVYTAASSVWPGCSQLPGSKGGGSFSAEKIRAINVGRWERPAPPAHAMEEVIGRYRVLSCQDRKVFFSFGLV